MLIVYAGLNLLVCLPIHAWLAMRSRHASPNREVEAGAPPARTARHGGSRSPLFWLMLAGFAIEGFVLSAILVHMVPLTTMVGLGTSGVFVAGLFGPAQVASRFINMLFGHNLRQSWLAPLATASLAAGLLTLLVSAPSVAGAALFTILFGLGSGLMSIVGGTLPLELFGREGYGAMSAG